LTRLQIISLLIMPLLVVACGPGIEAQQGTIDEVAFTTNIFSPDTLAAGSSIAGWRVKTVNMVPALDRPRDFVGTVSFEGEATVRGRFAYRERGEDLCFYVDAADAGKLPRIAQDSRIALFCFDGAPVPAERVTTDTTVAIVISDYVLTYAFTDVTDTARLVRFAPQDTSDR
jgi:hypothetical protein